MKLITNGDDFGITKAANYGIIDCFKDGILRSTSMMVNMPAAAHAANLMKENPDLSVGIHLTLTVGKPLITTHKTLLNDNGTFNKGMLKDSDHVDSEEIRAELYAQMDKFKELTGQNPTHINSHHGIEVIKGAEEIVCEIAQKYDLPVRRFFTLPTGNHENINYEIPLMKHSDSAMDFSSMAKDTDLTTLYTKAELESDSIFEFASHPGYVDYEIYQISSLTIGRAYDAAVFLSETVKNWVKENNIELVDYSALKKL